MAARDPPEHDALAREVCKGADVPLDAEQFGLRGCGHRTQNRFPIPIRTARLLLRFLRLLLLLLRFLLPRLLLRCVRTRPLSTI